MRRSDITQKVLDRFEAKYIRGTKDECWIWTAANAFHLGKRNETPMRVAYLIQYGDFDQSLQCLRTCSTPSCINPHHLFLCTHADIARDTIQKGRKRTGEPILKPKIAETDIPIIKELYKSGKHNQYELAAMFKVSQGYINRIIKLKRRKIK